MLDLHDNQLRGTVPVAIRHVIVPLALYVKCCNIAFCSLLENLRNLSLQVNALTGRVPLEVGELIKLEYMNLARNELFGRLPDSLGGLVDLRWLSLHDNEFTGSLHPSLGQLVKCVHMDFHNNLISGTVPETFNQLKSLQLLDLSRNHLQVGPRSPTHKHARTRTSVPTAFDAAAKARWTLRVPL